VYDAAFILLAHHRIDVYNFNI